MSDINDLTYRTVGDWGVGKGSNLTPEEVDDNFYQLILKIISLEENPAQPLEIDSIDVDGDQMTIWLSDGYTSFTVTLPTVELNPTGAFVGGTDYSKFDLFYANSGLYMVLEDHVAADEFDPDAESMQGPLYGFLMPAATNYDFGIFVPGQPGSGIVAGEPVWQMAAPRGFILREDLPGSQAYLGTTTTAAMTLSIRKDGASIGSVNFGAGAQIGTFTLNADVEFEAGDILDILRPSSLDTTARNLSISLVAERT